MTYRLLGWRPFAGQVPVRQSLPRSMSPRQSYRLADRRPTGRRLSWRAPVYSALSTAVNR